MKATDSQQTEVSKTSLEEAAALLDDILGVQARTWGNTRKLPAAIRITEELEPAGGFDIPFYPASYAGAVYDLNGVERDAKGNVIRARQCVVDSYQSQANRMEPAFKGKALSPLVPQFLISIPRKDEEDKLVNALDVSHRVADFRVRLSEKKEMIGAIESWTKGDALPLVQLMPTSIVFGFWDSRDTGTKHARILMSRIDAFDVVPCQRNSIYTGEYSKDEMSQLLGEDLGPEKSAAEIDSDAGVDGGAEKKASKDKIDKVLSGAGFTSALSSGGLGGVFAKTITRTSVISLSALTQIHCKEPGEEKPSEALTNAARRYLFCLAILAEGYQRENHYLLRSGCELIPLGEAAFSVQGGEAIFQESLEKLAGNLPVVMQTALEAGGILNLSKGETIQLTTDAIKKEFDRVSGKNTKNPKPAGAKGGKK